MSADAAASRVAVSRSVRWRQATRKAVIPACSFSVDAIIEKNKPGNNNLGEAFNDNIIIVPYAGVAVSSFSASQRGQLLGLMALYVNNLEEGHAQVRMSEIEAQLALTYFAWIGGTDEDSAYYYRIHSPVILIEFDHRRPVGMRHLFPDRSPRRQHIHAVVRTPNGNDYGKDLLRQHLKQHPPLTQEARAGPRQPERSCVVVQPGSLAPYREFAQFGVAGEVLFFYARY